MVTVTIADLSARVPVTAAEAAQLASDPSWLTTWCVGVLGEKLAKRHAKAGRYWVYLERGPDEELPIVRQCDLLGVSRSSLYYRAKGAFEEDLSLMRDGMDRQYLEAPFYG